ncbi:hypothetical protein HYU96_03635 [Candidatus Daviesbacteria bacterium]|nr:hypothetical protein [Candidatus Daviesbacteria bacterium]
MSFEASATHEEVSGKSPRPEIINSPALPTLRLIYSIPVADEWSNGFLLRNLMAMLSQRLDHGTSIEINYLINQKGSVTSPENEESQASLALLRKIVDIQGLVRNQDQTDGLTEISNPLIRDVLRLAVRKADSIAISAIDVTRVELVPFGYPGSRIDQIRTLGMDYARARLNDKPDAVISLFDVDTVPDTNSYSQKVLKIFDIDSSTDYLFANLAYLPPGNSRDLIATSFFFTRSKLRNYNLRLVEQGSPQILFRSRACDDLKEVAGYRQEGYSGFSDWDLARRLARSLRSLPQFLLFDRNLYIPAVLTSDREGTVDGQYRQISVKIADLNRPLNNIHFPRDLDMDTYYLEIRRMFSFANGSYSQDKDTFERYCDQVYEHYRKNQRLQLRFNRFVARSLIDALSKGEIRRGRNSLTFNSEALLKKPAGRALLHFIAFNQNLIGALTDSDIAVMKYYLGLNDFPHQRFSRRALELSPFQRAMREYLGEFENLDSFRRQENEYHVLTRDDWDRRALLPGLVADILATAHIQKTVNYSFDRDERREKLPDPPAMLSGNRKVLF